MKTPTEPAQTPISGLPFSEGRSFTSLDAYLAFLEKQGEFDTPWYRRIGPDLYQEVARRGPGVEPRTFTRRQLAEKFGFAEPSAP